MLFLCLLLFCGSCVALVLSSRCYVVVMLLLCCCCVIVVRV